MILICDFCKEEIELGEDRRLIEGKYARICDKCIMEVTNILEVTKEMEVEENRSRFKLIKNETE